MRASNIFILIIAFSNTILAQGTWIQKADVGGNGRFGGIGFSVGNFGYIGTGSGG
ncbi:MAG: hypothetical protein LH473_05100 [Chitinophagales bacterium]|nr:hypothetical protein [Chitinophagales bacterium]